MAEYVISIYLDTRRKKDKDLYPVKLRVYFNYSTRFYPTGINLTKEDFERSYLAEKPRGGYKDTKLEILSNLTRAIDIAKELKQFDFDQFEKRLFRAKGEGNNVFYHYVKAIEAYQKDEQYNTASNYFYSVRSLIDFLFSRDKYKSISNAIGGRIEASKEFTVNNIGEFFRSIGKGMKLDFDELTVDFLKKYERWMLGEGKSKTTIGIYLRPLRAIYNGAISSENIPKETYPFGKQKYKIPAGRKVKKALTKAELKQLVQYPVEKGSPQEKARDLWLFTYLCNGMNVRDMCDLKESNYNGSTIVFYRHKIRNTTRDDQKPIIVPVTDWVKDIIKKHGNKKRGMNDYIFPIFIHNINEEERVRRAKNLVRFINQHLKRLAEQAGVTAEVSCNWARHSFSTIAVNSGASLEFIQDSLGHKDIKTTMNYWGGFEDATKKDIANKLLDF